MDIRIDTEEDGFWLSVQVHTTGYRWRIDDPEAFHDHVKAAILPWLIEREEAERSYRRAQRENLHVVDSEAYDISDPKHPDFHSVHADLYDQREGK